MGNFQYLNGAVWTDVPDVAHPTDEGGEITLQWPEPTAIDGTGKPCGAFGSPRIIIRSAKMRGDGWAWWQAFFSGSNLYATMAGLKAYDQRTGTWKQCTNGILFRPKGVCRPAGSLAMTLYEGVEIVIEGVTVA